MNREAYLYSPSYCEENIWHLCQEPDFEVYDKKVVFISNDRRSCPLWNQRACVSLDQPVLWDYHVILLFRNENWQVYDLDTLLATPTPLGEYIQNTFTRDPVAQPFLPVFRVIEADEFVSVFSSDRSHMLTADGTWQAPPPPWPTIVRNNQSNLMELVDMRNPSFGTIMDLSRFETLFAARRS